MQRVEVPGIALGFQKSAHELAGTRMPCPYEWRRRVGERNTSVSLEQNRELQKDTSTSERYFLWSIDSPDSCSDVI